MKAEVKICGLDRVETVEASVEAGAGMIGFVFYSPSPRSLTPTEASVLTARVPSDVRRIGLFVDPTDEEISKVMDKNRFDMVQLHGEETPQRVLDIKELIGLPVMKVLKISCIQDLNTTSEYECVTDWFLFDAFSPKDIKGALPGGNALSFDWSILSGVDISQPWVLAGGLNPENVKEAMQTSGARVVDVSSGVEDRPGVKSIVKIRTFIEAVLTA